MPKRRFKRKCRICGYRRILVMLDRKWNENTIVCIDCHREHHPRSERTHCPECHKQGMERTDG